MSCGPPKVIATALILVGLAAASPAVPPWRLVVEPTDEAQAAVREAARQPGNAGIEALRTVSERFPTSPASGLARLAAGLRLRDQARHQEAIAELTHADVARTGLLDWALEAIGDAQEALGQNDAAARAYLAAAAEPSSAVACSALPKASRLLLPTAASGAAAALEQAVADCGAPKPQTLLALGDAHLAAGDAQRAGAAWERIESDAPASAEAGLARQRLDGLGTLLPAQSPERRAQLAWQRGKALHAAGRHGEAIQVLRGLRLELLDASAAAEARVSLGGSLLAKGRAREATRELSLVPEDSPAAARAAFLLARDQSRRTRRPEAFESVARRHRGTPWGEEALLALANHYQKDALDALALPWWRRLLAEYPDGRYVERAALRVGLADFQAGRHESAAQTLEAAARLRPGSTATAGLLYWSARARLAQGHTERAKALLQETVRRYRYAYHGLRAGEALSRLGAAPPRPPALLPDGSPEALPEPRATRARHLLLIERLDDAARELRLLPPVPQALATIAWIDWRQGRLRSAIVGLKRAYPEWITEAGDRLPTEVWRILFPLRYEDHLARAAAGESVDAALVAALILQESTFDAAALSRAGARGLMQVMPATGRRIARAKGQRLRRAALHDPVTSIDFGTHYLRQMSDRFGGSVEKVLAAYNAGPHRVDTWTAQRGELEAELFIESIPFTETRQYVMIVLANREHYRRLYGLGRVEPGPVNEGPRP